MITTKFNWLSHMYIFTLLLIVIVYNYYHCYFASDPLQEASQEPFAPIRVLLSFLTYVISDIPRINLR